jgi:lysophospholipase L1-like esterase
MTFYGDRIFLPGIASGPPSPVLEDYTQNLVRTLEILHQKGPEKVLLWGISTPISEAWSESSDAFMIDMPPLVDLRKKVAEYNGVIQKQAETFGFEYLQTEALWPQDMEERRAFFADGLHPNTLGYTILFQVIYEAVDTMLREDFINP